MVSVIDYGLGNISSVVNAFSYWDKRVNVVSTPDEIEKSQRLVLPGVGSFKEAMTLLKKKDLIGSLHDAVLGRKKPVFGICLGMQIMASFGEEGGGCEGLGWIKGEVSLLFKSNIGFKLSIPHIGFNEVKNESCYKVKDYYFCHSYKLTPHDLADYQYYGLTDYGGEFVALIKKENIWGTQFHPEKSQANGLMLIKQFLSLEKENA